MSLESNESNISTEAKDDNSWSYVTLVAIAGGFCQQGILYTIKVTDFYYITYDTYKTKK